MYEGYEHYESRDSDPIILVPNPLYHCFGCVAGSATAVYINGTMVLPNPIPTTQITADCIEEYKCNYLYGTPTMWSDLLSLGSSRLDRLTSLKRGTYFSKLNFKLKFKTCRRHEWCTMSTKPCAQSDKHTSFNGKHFGKLNNNVMILIVLFCCLQILNYISYFNQLFL